jgi:hypothetical protein
MVVILLIGTCFITQFIGVPEKDKQFSVMSAIGLGHNTELKCINSSRDSDDNVVTVPTPKGGIRRKHHRAWTLSEVMKLVEGVSRYGAGRWSEIKRLAFASYSYRTSVDLKVSPWFFGPCFCISIQIHLHQEFLVPFQFQQVFSLDAVLYIFLLKGFNVQDKWRNLLKASLAPQDNGVRNCS